MFETQLSPLEITKRVAEMYGRYPFPPPQRKHTYRQHAAYVHSFLDEIGIDPRGKTFGDIACGTGLMLLDYAREFPESQLVGYDLSDTSIRRANDTLRLEGITNAYCEVRDLTRLDREEEFDYIVSWGTLHHLPDARLGLRRLSRALKHGGILRLGVYGFFGNSERRIQQEIIQTITADPEPLDLPSKIQVVREWARGDRNFKNYYTAPPVDLGDDAWVVDEFLHVWEKHLRLRDVVSWLQDEGMQILRLTDYYDQPIPLDIAQHSTSQPFIDRVKALPFAEQCHVIDLIVRPYWLSLLVKRVE